MEKQKMVKKEKLMKKPGKVETKPIQAPSDLGHSKLLNSSQANYGSIAAKQFLYKPFVLLPDLTDLIGKTIEIRIHKAYLTKFNKAVQFQQFFGNDFYSSDSDAVCILQHQGAINLTDREPIDFEGIAGLFKVAKARSNYPNLYKNGIKS